MVHLKRKYTVRLNTVVSTNSKICREPNIFGVLHSKSGKNRRNFGQETEKFSREQTFHKIYGHGFPLTG
jgi:hypothetical protein